MSKQKIKNTSEEIRSIEELFYEFANQATYRNPVEVFEKHKALVERIKGVRNEHPVYLGFNLVVEGAIDYFKSNFKKSILDLKKGISILEEYGKKDAYGVGYMLLGGAYRSLGELDTSVDYLMKGTETLEDNSPVVIFQSYSNYQLAEIYSFIMDYQSAMEYYQRSLKTALKVNNPSAIFRSYNGVGNLLVGQGDLEGGYRYLKMASEIKHLSEAQKSRGICDLGIYYLEIGELDEARRKLNESLRIREEAGYMDAACTSLIHLGKVELKDGNQGKALKYLEGALDLAIKYESGIKQQDCYRLLAEIYRSKGAYEQASEYYQLYDELQMQYNKSRIQNIYKLKNAKIREQKELIEEAYTHIQDSLNYAKRIQEAILPSDSDFFNHFPDAFVYYVPKDIVAGDFYWFDKKEDQLFFAVADCTGHGVPGALVSVICHNALNRSLWEYDCSNPGDILNKTRELVLEAFSRSEVEMKDGMDIALCCYDRTSKILKYSGAYNPAYIIRKNTEQSNTELIEYKPHRQPIGKFDLCEPFQDKEIDLKEGDILYLFSDGFYDQFGGAERKKLMRRNFKSLLIECSSKPISEQCNYLNEQFTLWKGSVEQTDDVCVIGIKF